MGVRSQIASCSEKAVSRWGRKESVLPKGWLASATFTLVTPRLLGMALLNRRFRGKGNLRCWQGGAERTGQDRRKENEDRRG